MERNLTKRLSTFSRTMPNEVHKKNGIAYNYSCKRYKPNHRSGSKRSPKNQWPCTIPISVSGIGVRMTSGNLKFHNCPTNRKYMPKLVIINAAPHISERHIRDLPLSVPKQ